MKKYILSENQIKVIVDTMLVEQNENQQTVMAVQCFLNQVAKANLVIDGKTGHNSQTENALKLFQSKKNKLGYNIDVDGVWGYNTQSTLTPEEKQIWKKCVRKYTLFESQINEQVPPEDEEQLPEPEQEPAPLPADEPEEQPDHPDGQRPKQQKKVKPYDKVKQKWLEENPYLSENVLEDAIDFFNRKKNGLRVYKSPESDPNYANLPEVNALVARFPELLPILSDQQKMRDIQNYTWDQMEFYMDRFGVADVAPIMDFNIVGDTIERKLQSAYKIWEKTENLIVNDNNLRIFKITGTDETISLGRLQRLLNDKYRSSQYGTGYWCVTHSAGEGSNLYGNYRPYSVYHFVLNKNVPEDHPWYVLSINACDMNSTAGRQHGPFFVTPRPNGSQMGKKWEDVCRIEGLSSLRDKEHLFRYYPLTSKERASAVLDRINFRKRKDPSTGRPIFDDNHFNLQSFAIQKQYITSGRIINDVDAFRVLPWNTSKDPEEREKDLRGLYIKHTNLNNWDTRFKTSDPEDPFGLLNIIKKETPQHYKLLNHILEAPPNEGGLAIKGGVNAIKLKIIGNSYLPRFLDMSKNYVCFRPKDSHIHGVMSLENLTWIKELERSYVASTAVMAIKGDGRYIFQRFTSRDGDDYFYFVFTFNDYYNKQSPTRGQGLYFDGPDGDAEFNNGNYRKLNWK